MKIVAIVQARLSSVRLPAKVMLPLADSELVIDVLLKRLEHSRLISQIVIATSTSTADDKLADYLIQKNYLVFRGSQHNVLDRYYAAAKNYNADIIVRITADCPFIDPQLMDSVIEMFINHPVDYCSNVFPPTFPDGLDVEVFSMKALAEAHQFAQTKYQKEHVTPYIQDSRSNEQIHLKHSSDLSHYRWTLDEPLDYEVLKNIYQSFAPAFDFSWQDILERVKDNPEFKKNNVIPRNQGEQLSTGQKLWKRAKTIIPGGNMLLSKRPEMYLPERWPAYYSKSQQCYVWDLDGNRFTDLSTMGIGTNILGYNHPKINESVSQVIKQGVSSSLNCPEEVELAEMLVELHPWADMVRLARTGGEANAIAIRIARAATAKSKVAICGYHGWHDWYLSANLSQNDQLDNHLLPGLEPNGVPDELAGTTLPFNYNDYETLQKLVNEHDIGVIKMEVTRNEPPKDDFLKKVRELATRNNIVLIFDECTSGFRETLGGIHKKFDVSPDIAVFGKALGNGYAITAVIGKRDIMEAAQTSFISSTFWTERIGPTAAIATLKEMQTLHSWQIVSETGAQVQKLWQQLADNHQLKITQYGLPALAGFDFQSSYNQSYKTLLSQQMLKQNILAFNGLYSCIDHSQAIIDHYIDALDPIFKTISLCEKDEYDINTLLEVPVAHSGFKRLN